MSEHFIIAGAQRCGTTGLYALFAQHPAICMARPVRPEPKFFLREDAVAAGRDSYLAQYFGHHTDETLLGEKTTSYIERQDAIARIKTVLPGVRLVFVLRDPARRAWSNWCFSRSHGIENLDFEQALDAEQARLVEWDHERFSVCPYAYATRGHYATYLARWAECFERDNILVVTSEVLFNSLAASRSLLAGLGVDPDVALQLPGNVNASDPHDCGQAPDAILQRLREHYHDDRQQLADEWDLDTSPWQP